MRVKCTQCGKQFAIADEKVPEGKTITVPCPSCKGPIRIEGKTAVDPPSGSPEPEVAVPPPPADEEDSLERPFDILDPGSRTALICVNDPAARGRLKEALGDSYHVSEPQSGVDALKKLRSHPFDLVLFHERYDGASPDDNPIANYINRMGMDVRRNMFVVLLSDRFNTMDNLTAFKQSVNLVVNWGHIGSIGQIVEKAIADHEAFYRVYREVAGRL